MARNCIGKMKAARIAAGRCVRCVSKTKRPRYIDRSLTAISHIFILRGLGFFAKDEVLETVRIMHVESGDPVPLGKHVERCVGEALITLANTGYIAFDETKEMIRVRTCAARMMRKIDQWINEMHFHSDLEKLFAHCDNFRQRVGNAPRVTIKGLRAEIEELNEEIAKLKAVFPQQTPLETPGEISDTESIEADIEMDESPVAGPSNINTSINITPMRRTASIDPAAAYLTPTSLPRRQESRNKLELPPPLPTPLSRLPTSRFINDAMNIDNQPELHMPTWSQPVTPSTKGIFGRCFEKIGDILSFPIRHIKTADILPEDIVQQIQYSLEASKAISRSLVKKLENCEEKLQAANDASVKQDHQLRREIEEAEMEIVLLEQDSFDKDALITTMAEENSRLTHERDEERTLRIATDGNLHLAIQAQAKLKAESAITRNKLFHSEIQRKALLKRVGKLEKDILLIKRENYEDIQYLRSQINGLKVQIDEEKERAESLLQRAKLRETELEKEVGSVQNQLRRKNEKLGGIFDYFSQQLQQQDQSDLF